MSNRRQTARHSWHSGRQGLEILVDDKIRCVIPDLGQSETKSKVRRISGKSTLRMFPVMNIPNSDPHYSRTDGTLRWQAPELMAESNSQFRTPMDVYVFAICSVEILSKGYLPWSLPDNETVWHLILSALAFRLRRTQPSHPIVPCPCSIPLRQRIKLQGWGMSPTMDMCLRAGTQ